MQLPFQKRFFSVELVWYLSSHAVSDTVTCRQWWHWLVVQGNACTALQCWISGIAE